MALSSTQSCDVYLAAVQQFVALPFSKADAARCQAAEEAAHASAEECKAKAESEQALKETNAAIQAELKDVKEQLAAATAAAAAAEKASAEAAAGVVEVEALRVELATTQEKLIAAESSDENGFDLLEELMGNIAGADGDAYSSIFVPTGGGTNTEFWLKKAFVEIKNVRGSLQRIADLK